MEKSGKVLSNEKRKLYSVLAGVGAGIANGLFGGGGGMIIVPILTHLLKYPAKNAHATAILIILPLSFVSGLFYVAFGVQVSIVIPVVSGVCIGGVLGAFLLPKLSNKWISVIFSFLMLVAGVKLLLF